MRRILTLAVFLLAAFAIYSCSGNDSNNSNQEGDYADYDQIDHDFDEALDNFDLPDNSDLADSFDGDAEEEDSIDIEQELDSTEETQIESEPDLDSMDEPVEEEFITDPDLEIEIEFDPELEPDIQDDAATDEPDEPEENEPTIQHCQEFDDPNELIHDRHFQRGVISVNPYTLEEIVDMPTGFCYERPIWQFALGHSVSILNSVPRQTLDDGSVKWEDDYGHLIIGRTGTPEADFILAVWGYALYNGQYYQPGPQQGWVFHLLQQRITNPYVPNNGSPPISALESLNFNVYGQLLHAERNQQAGYDPNHHAAQFLIYFTVQNLNMNSAGFGDYLWFGVTLYDDRTDVPGITILQDAGGTEKLIYNVGAEPFVSRGLQVGGPGLTYSGDILPFIRDALIRAWQNGFLQGSNVLSDYKIGGMNIGWEVSGLNDVEMHIRDLSLKYSRKPATPVVFGFDTDGDREGWTATNITELTNGPKDGLWIFQVHEQPPMLLSPELNLEAATHPIIRIKMANDHNPADTALLKIYWDRFGDRGLREAWNVSRTIANDGGWYTIEFDMSNNPAWTGEIHQVRVDPILRGDGHAVGIDEIAFLPAR